MSPSQIEQDGVAGQSGVINMDLAREMIANRLCCDSVDPTGSSAKASGSSAQVGTATSAPPQALPLPPDQNVVSTQTYIAATMNMVPLFWPQVTVVMAVEQHHMPLSRPIWSEEHGRSVSKWSTVSDSIIRMVSPRRQDPLETLDPATGEHIVLVGYRHPDNWFDAELSHPVYRPVWSTMSPSWPSLFEWLVGMVGPPQIGAVQQAEASHHVALPTTSPQGALGAGVEAPTNERAEVDPPAIFDDIEMAEGDVSQMDSQMDSSHMDYSQIDIPQTDFPQFLGGSDGGVVDGAAPNDFLENLAVVEYPDPTEVLDPTSYLDMEFPI